MAYTLEQFTKEFVASHLGVLTPDEIANRLSQKDLQTLLERLQQRQQKSTNNTEEERDLQGE
ncbi:hypothetical protein D5085_01165 [Ectothiorhodospiraceae bacterium BW-2]|nr:hypothetical protein D5085_01165 [Ectothiorhodospiraceae bacterium BW-2]